jgi:hypothetical protein
MVKSIIQVARAVGKQTIAEYVQDAETLAMLRELGVDYAQGYHIGKPAAALLDEAQPLNGSPAQEIGWREFQNDVAQLCVNWYLRERPSFRRLEALLLERGLPVRHTTIHRWVRPHALQAGDSPPGAAMASRPVFRVEEGFAMLKGQRKYLYRAMDCDGRMLDFVLCDAPAREAAALFFRRRVPGEGLETTGEAVSCG